MSPNIQGQVAQNRRSVQRLDGNFVTVPDRQGNNLSFSRNTIEVSVDATLYTRPLNDSLISGHPDAKHGSGRGVSGDVRGEWSAESLTIQSVDFVRDGRNSVRDALAGESGALRETAVGTGTSEVADTDAALNAETGRTPAYGIRSTEANNAVRAQSDYLFAETGPSDQDLTEFGLFAEDGRMLARVVTDPLPKTPEDEVRVDFTVTFSGSAQTGGAVTDEGEAAIADSIQDPQVTIGLDEMAWGEGTTDATESDTSLDNEVHRKTVERNTDLELIEVSAPMFESEPASQPHDFTEVGVFDNDGRMVYRVTFNPYDKDDSIRFTTRVGFRIV